MSKNPIVPAGYDQEELWAHEENQKLIEAQKKKNAADKAAKDEAEAGDADDDKLHQRYYGDDSDPNA